ncbi:unnamed protein product [Knipowitschia caucasica]|uniref:Myb-like domain-containing protein n=1 Tax=Knipowitschia caucasica TaxID=637954 RepID=A0AAV2JHD5_KNICA
MASSYYQLHDRAHRESPAKIFARLKSNLQRTAAEDSADEEGPAAMPVSRVLYTPKRGTQTRGEGNDLSLVQSFERGEVTAVTLSPISSPTKQNCTIANMPRHRHLMESTRCNQPAFQTHPHGHGIHTTTTITSDGFVLREAGDLENVDSPLFICSDSVFSPMKKRLRKRKCAMNTSNYGMSAMDYALSSKKDRKISPPFREDELISKSAAQYSPQRRNGGAVHTLPVNFTPAKMFTYLKLREKLREQCDAPQRVMSSSRPEADWDCQSDVRIGKEPAASSVDRLSPGDGSSDEDFILDAESEEPPLPVILEDSVVLNSPRVSIPKETVCRRTKWPHCITFPSENAVHLRKWFLQGRRKGLYVEGIHREKNIEWHSNIIAERISKSALRTVTGSVYILVGKMSLFTASPFPKWFLKKFVNGFPSNWKELHEDYLSESKGKFNKKPEAKTEKRSQTSKTSVRAEQLQSSVSSCPSSAPSITNVSRSGRVIKPPLDYWKGGRVIMDAHMNVTIHDSYNSSIVQPKDTPSVSTKSFLLKPDQPIAPVINVSESPLQRRIKARPRKPRQSQNDAITKSSSPVYTTATSTRVTRSSTRSSGSGTSDNSPPKELKKPQKNATKANNVKLGQRLSPSAITTSSQPGKEKSSEGRRQRDRPRPTSGSSHSSRERNTATPKNQLVKEAKARPKRRSKTPPPVASAVAATQKAAQPNRTHKRKPRSKPIPAHDEDEWTEEELGKLHEAVSCFPTHIPGYWAKVAMTVGTRSAEECHKRHVAFGAAKTPVKCQRKAKVEPLKEKAKPVISAGVGTLRRKQQVRDFLETMAKDEMDDVFSSAYMQSKRFEVPSMSTSDHHDFTISNQAPITPGHTGFPEAKTPQCLHITPGMIGSSSKNCDDKYVFHLQKRMKNRYQFNVEKHAKKTNFTPVSVKKAMRRCANTENNTFVVWEMFPDKEAQADSEEEQDVYFSEND